MRALYDYFPEKDSPNPNPEMELSLNAGDIITIYGVMVRSLAVLVHNLHLMLFNCSMKMAITLDMLMKKLDWYHQILLKKFSLTYI